MGRRKSKEKLNARELCEIGKISYGTLLYWTKEGLLKYEQVECKKWKHYDRKYNLEIIRKIKKLKERRFTIAEIKAKLLGGSNG